jgi:TonB family protein
MTVFMLRMILISCFLLCTSATFAADDTANSSTLGTARCSGFGSNCYTEDQLFEWLEGCEREISHGGYRREPRAFTDYRSLFGNNPVVCSGVLMPGNIGKNFELRDLKIVRSSGSNTADQAALQLLKSALPLTFCRSPLLPERAMLVEFNPDVKIRLLIDQRSAIDQQAFLNAWFQACRTHIHLGGYNWLYNEIGDKPLVCNAKVDDSGRVVDAKIVVSSGLQSADEAALALIRKESPLFPAPPVSLPKEGILIEFYGNRRVLIKPAII